MELFLIGFVVVLVGFIVGKLSNVLSFSWVISLMLSILAGLWWFDAEFWYIMSLSVGYIYPETQTSITISGILIIFALTMVGVFLSALGEDNKKVEKAGENSFSSKNMTTERICFDCGKEEDFTGAPYVKLKVGGSVCGNCAETRRTKKE